MAIKAKRKILYIITKSVWGGAGTYVYDLAANLSNNEFEVVVAAGGRDELAAKIAGAGLQYHEIKNFQRDINVFKDLLAIFEILKLIKKIRPDIVHVNSSKAGGIVGIAVFLYKLKNTNRKIKNIFTAHGWAFNENRPKWQIFLIKLSSKLACCFYDKIICVSEFDRLSAVKNKIAPDKKLITIHNGVKIADYNFLPRQKARKQFHQLELGNSVSNLETEFPSSEIWVGTIGEFTGNKGQEYLIEALKSLVKRHPSLIAVVIGWGEEKTNLSLLVTNYSLQNNVFLVDNLSPAAPYLKAIDIFVLPSLKEGLPYTLLEAGLAELPVIASGVGGIPEIIENQKNGLLVNPGNPGELASALEKLINDKPLRKNLAGALRTKILEEFSFEKMLNFTLAAYEEKPRAGN